MMVTKTHLTEQGGILLHVEYKPGDVKDPVPSFVGVYVLDTNYRVVGPNMLLLFDKLVLIDSRVGGIALGSTLLSRIAEEITHGSH